MMYNQKIIKRNNSTLKFGRKTVIKITKPGHREWEERFYNLYVLFAKDYSYAVKPVSWKTDMIYEMERLDIVCDGYDILSEHDDADNLGPYATLENALKIVKFYNQIYLDCLEFSAKHLPEGKYFFHDDLNLSNVVLTSSGEIKLIDCEAFSIEENLLNISHKSHSQAALLKAHLLSETLQKQNDPKIKKHK